MRGHIHKRVRKNAAGKETVRWYIVVDVGVASERLHHLGAFAMISS